MSDEGSTGGDVFQIPAGGGAARDLTPGMASSASNITWPRNSRQLYFTEHFDGGSAISQLDPATARSSGYGRATRASIRPSTIAESP